MGKLPLSGITVSAVKSVLGAGSNDVGALCTHPNINMWSRRKPVIYPGIPSTSDWMLGIKRNSGIVVPEITNIPSDIDSTNWTYERPYGGTDSPFRLGDFRGYNHDAIPIISRVQSSFSVDPTTSKIVDVEFEFINDNTTYPDNLNAMDIISPNLQDLCLACVVVDSKGVVVKTVENDGYLYINNNISLDTTGLASGDYKVYFYLTNEYKTKKYALYRSDDMPNPAALSVTAHVGYTTIMHIGWDFWEGDFYPANEVVGFQKVVSGDYICFLLSLYNATDVVKVFEKSKFGCRLMCLGYEDERYFTAPRVDVGGWLGEISDDGYANDFWYNLPSPFSLQPGEGKYIYIQIEPCWILDSHFSSSDVLDLSVQLTYNNEIIQSADVSFRDASGGWG